MREPVTCPPPTSDASDMTLSGSYRPFFYRIYSDKTLPGSYLDRSSRKYIDY
ncbi:hypothetical protein [Paenibacillus sp. YAF4_2]|uniref:hypothetical protein n=1 Tax=Paenibacillus sp. YAF4_2 TaxID=3233085 RepID=UPI003F949AF6